MGLAVGWCGGECDGVFLQQLSMSAHPPVPEWLRDSHVCIKDSVLLEGEPLCW